MAQRRVLAGAMTEFIDLLQWPSAWALVVLQFCLAATNIRGAIEAKPEGSS